MEKYKVVIIYETSNTIDVEAESPEDALLKIPRPNDKENCRYIVCDDTGEAELYATKSKLQIYEDTLNSVINHVACAENTFTQIKTLTDMGFSKELLQYFGYDSSDIDDVLIDDHGLDI